jgi:hypothetical protein
VLYQNIKTIEEAPKGKMVFREWVHSWTRLTLIKVAIRDVLQGSWRTVQKHDHWWEKPNETGVVAAIEAVTHLADVERFVFVMSVLEGYSAKECSLLLNCGIEAVLTKRTRALSELPSSHQALLSGGIRSFGCVAAIAHLSVSDSLSISDSRQILPSQSTIDSLAERLLFRSKQQRGIGETFPEKLDPTPKAEGPTARYPPKRG